MIIPDNVRVKFIDPEDPLLRLLEDADEETRLFQSIALFPTYEGTLTEALAALPLGKKLNDDLLWKMGEIAGCGQNESGRLRYNAAGTWNACIQNGTAEAILRVLESEHVKSAFLNVPALFRSATTNGTTNVGIV